MPLLCTTQDLLSTELAIKVKVKVLPAPMAHRAVPISVSIALGHASANAVRATVGGAGPLGAPRV